MLSQGRVGMSDVVFIGTSDAFGAGGRRQAAILLRTGGGAVLLDCGTTTNTGLNALSISRQEIEVILISHFHADHFGGVPLFLLAALYEDARRHPLQIAGPPGIERRVRAAAAALGHSLEERAWSFPLLFQELPAGAESALGPVRVRSFETRHQPDSCPHGLTLQWDSRRMVYSGDTGWFEGLPEHARGADLFVCECTFAKKSFDYHLSYEELLERKGTFDCGRMLLTHLGQTMSARRGTCAIETADDGLLLKL